MLRLEPFLIKQAIAYKIHKSPMSDVYAIVIKKNRYHNHSRHLLLAKIFEHYTPKKKNLEKGKLY